MIDERQTFAEGVAAIGSFVFPLPGIATAMAAASCADNRFMDEQSVLFDTRTGLYVRWYFWLRVLDEANRAARYGEPFGLLLLDASGGTERQREEAAAAVPAVVRNTDIGGALGAGRVGILLPYQDVESAETAAFRITSALHSSSASVRWVPRLLCHPADAAEISNELTAESRSPDGAPSVLRAG
jgi:GGDEF domain-containing protein